MSLEFLENFFEGHPEEDVFIWTIYFGKEGCVEEKEIFCSISVFIFPELGERHTVLVEVEHNLGEVLVQNLKHIMK